MAAVVCGEAQLPAYNATTGIQYCSSNSAATLCVSYYGPGIYTVSPTGNCVRAIITASPVACPPGYAPVCGMTCVCASSAGASLLPGGNATPSSVISSLQVSHGVPCSGVVACFFTQQLPYALCALAVLVGGALLAIYRASFIFTLTFTNTSVLQVLHTRESKRTKILTHFSPRPLHMHHHLALALASKFCGAAAAPTAAFPFAACTGLPAGAEKSPAAPPPASAAAEGTPSTSGKGTGGGGSGR